MGAAADADRSLLRDAAPITAWNLVSRVTGLLRVLVIGGALGTTFLGNTYQSANLVSNVLFELVAAGLLSSVLVPTFVAQLHRDRHEAGALAGAVLGTLLGLLLPLVVIGMVAARPLMRVLTIAVDDPAVRADEIRLGATLLLFFLPQVLLYAVGAVATGLLHADRRFVAGAAAPVANNLLVIAAVAVFWATRDSVPGLDLDGGRLVLLGAGTTLGVLAMSAVPFLAVWRTGIRLRPRWDPGNPALRAMARQGAWAGGYLALTQVLTTVTIVLANRVEGGVVAYQIAFTCFLLPFALFANPIVTALFPRLASAAHRDDREEYRRDLALGLRAVLALLIPAAALLAAVALPAVRAVATGALTGGVGLVAAATAAYAAGLVGYAAFHLLTRAMYADGDTRTPTIVNVGVAALGTALMVLGTAAASSPIWRVAALGLAHSAALLAGAGTLAVIQRRRLRQPFGLAGSLARSVAAGASAGLVAWGVVAVLDGPGRARSVATVAAAGIAGLLAAALAGGGVRSYLGLVRGSGSALIEPAIPGVEGST